MPTLLMLSLMAVAELAAPQRVPRPSRRGCRLAPFRDPTPTLDVRGTPDVMAVLLAPLRAPVRASCATPHTFSRHERGRAHQYGYRQISM